MGKGFAVSRGRLATKEVYQVSWIVEGYEEPGLTKIIFQAEAQYLADVFLAVRDAASLDCGFIQIKQKGKRHNVVAIDTQKENAPEDPAIEPARELTTEEIFAEPEIEEN